ncbi:MAG TPA: M20/M25/M40 family metallo-hydrolase, partial [Acidimicrobiia bacterium]|nr:M20/M25/M40 family metallo-hydrolase [Acidimicrobiia bacterium]
MTSRKKTSLAVGVGVGAAAATALRRRWRGRSDSKSPVPVTRTAADHDVAGRFLEHLAAAIRIPTVSTEDGMDAAVFGDMRRFIESTYPNVHARLSREVVGEHTLFYTWPGTDPDAAPLLLMAHQDVVPVEPGTEEDWEHPPFSGAVAGEHLWGRGAIDDKGSLIGILEAVEGLLDLGFAPGPTIHLLFGHDEEVGGIRGAAVIARRLASAGDRLGLVVDEGGAVVSGLFPGVGPLALIGIGEKASLDVEITAVGDGGHSSLPPASTAVGKLAAAVRAIEEHPLPARLDVQRPFLEALSGAIGGLRGVLLRNLALSRRLVERLL